MEVILTENLEGVGEKGERKNVKPGFARNYLIPQGLAVYATDSLGHKIEKEFLEKEEKEEKLSESKEIVESIQNLNLEFDFKAEKGKKTYAGVNAKKIKDSLLEKYQIHAERVDLKGSIKQKGDHTVEITVGGKKYPVKVKVVSKK